MGFIYMSAGHGFIPSIGRKDLNVRSGIRSLITKKAGNLAFSFVRIEMSLEFASSFRNFVV